VIFIELSVYPHYKNCRYAEDRPLHPLPQTPPHVIIKREFKTTDGAAEFLRVLDLKADGNTIEDVIEATRKEYVGEEIELFETTGQVYTLAGLSIEGEEEPTP